MIRSTITVVVLLAAATACEQKPKSEPTATPAVTPARAPETTPVQVNPDEAALDQVPVQEDFEEQAAREVSPDNLDTELAKLESEIAD